MSCSSAEKALALLVGMAAMTIVAQAEVFVEEGYPLMWEKAPADLQAMAGADGVSINPWEYSQRMAMFRLILSNTDQYMRSLGPTMKEHPMWGLPLQQAWAYISGRLADPTGASTCGHQSDPMCISPRSLWGCVHYHLSVIPFLAAVKAGMIGDGSTRITVQAAKEDASDYCTTFDDCTTKNADMMAKWEKFYETLKTVGGLSVSDTEKQDVILGSMWDAQMASFKQTNKACAARQSHYSKQETSFTQAWVDSVELVGPTHYRTNLAKAQEFMKPLPGRLLLDTDSPPNIPDMTPEQNYMLKSFSWQNNMKFLMGGTFESMWKRAMCSDTAREKGRKLMDDMTLNTAFPLSTLIEVIAQMAYSC